ncbi:MAG: hypothetical protein HN732_00480, partial [Rhodospirillaceae bacterium]|nr:hypothetical protein [Rhodospirillaceae bacterium]
LAALLFLFLIVLGTEVVEAAKITRPSAAPKREATVPSEGAQVIGRRTEGRSLSRTTMPLVFEKNIGQANKQVRYLVRRPGFNLFLTPTSLVTVMAGLSGNDPRDDADRGHFVARPVKAPPSMALHMQLVGANSDADILGEDKLAARANLFFGNDAAAWKKGAPLHASVRYSKIYRDTDLHISSQSGRLAYSFMLGPRGRAAAIRMRFTGVASVSIDNRGRLVLVLPNGGRIRHAAPMMFEHIGGRQRRLKGRFRMLSRDTVGFKVAKRRPGSVLVIDPEIDFGTYFGGSGEEPLLHGFHRFNAFTIPALDMDLDEQGRLLIGGTTLSSDLPKAAGPIPPAGSSAFAARIDVNNPAGPRIDYVSYFAGSDADQGYGIAAGRRSTAYLCGRTLSRDFPIVGPAYGTTPVANKIQGFVLAVNDAGILKRTAIVDASDQTTILACDFDAFPNNQSMAGVYFTGQTGTAAPNSAIDPNIVTPGAAQRELAGFNDVFIAKLNPELSNLTYFTLLGGSFEDTGTDIVARDGVAVITGLSESWDFPATDGSLARHTLNNENGAQCGNYIHSKQCIETFVARLDRTGQNFDFVTMLGDSVADFGSGVDIDRNWDVYVVGQRLPSGASTEAFAVKLSANGETEIYRRNFAFGDARAFDVAVDQHDYAHLIGHVGSGNYEKGNPVGPFYGGNTDGFYATIDPAGNLFYFSYLGGSAEDRGYSIVLAENRCVYLGLETWSGSFNFSLPGVPQDTLAGASDLLILRHCDAGDPGALTLVKTAVPTIVETGQTVTFEIRLDNPGTWIAGPVVITDRVLLPFQPINVSGPNCSRSGQLITCTLNWISNEPVIIRIEAVNRMQCVKIGLVMPRKNTAKFQFADGSVREAEIEVFYRDCDPDAGVVSAECTTSSDCAGELLCVRHCEFLQYCQAYLGPICVRHSEYQLIREPPVCTPPEYINRGITECDRILE